MTEDTVVVQQHQDFKPLALLASLFETLNEQGIRYCHWKSNLNLEESLQGKTDLDLLVDRSHDLRFREVLLGYDFKPVQSPCHKQYPAMEDYLGFDRDSGELIHMHIHYQLILGEQFVKNYRLPLEQALLDSEYRRDGVNLPSPELETIVLVIRALLKTRDRDLLKGIVSPRSEILPASILAEFEALLGQTTPERISGVLESQVDVVSQDLVLEFLETIKREQGTGPALLRLRRRLRRELAAYQRFGRGRAIYLYVRDGLLPRFRVVPRRFLTHKRKTMMSGGLTLAVLGVDGAGKSTVIANLRRFLSWRLSLHIYYMGSQQPSRLTGAMGWVSHTTSRAVRAADRLLGKRNPRFLQSFAQVMRGLYLVAVGRDRHSRYIRGQRRAAQGDVVLYDRYPLPAVQMDGRYMDGPRIASSYPGEMGRVLAALSESELELYRQIRMPDHLIVLRVSPEVSVERKPDHKWEMIETKYQALQQMEPADLRVTEIDAEQPLDQVLLQVKTLVWDLL